ncbi:hypothetical protein MOX02_23830 [Methylobacterium oxalidis]|uniref:Uncharacterized protein n=1 Tax=Methylobacterium oxalidis TaxID=944322 RepID=A0A512J301_9HYPH|nr:hypothetical protein MOX02_23830 [Methylobacterium oxalidis]GLS67136.1 hypothetical protein GCM10007888_55190 [Methylobacterium oxalidis]
MIDDGQEPVPVIRAQGADLQRASVAEAFQGRVVREIIHVGLGQTRCSDGAAGIRSGRAAGDPMPAPLTAKQDRARA